MWNLEFVEFVAFVAFVAKGRFRPYDYQNDPRL
jgi:hypothetical protein